MPKGKKDTNSIQEFLNPQILNITHIF